MNFITGLDRRPLAEIRSAQSELLREQVRYAFARSPFYRERLAGVDADSLSMDDLSGLPLTSKEDIQRKNSAFLCVEDKDVAEVVATTGTTGEHVYVYLTKNDLVRLAENEKRCFSYAGIGADDLVLLSVTLDNLFIAGLAYYTGLVRLGAGVIRLGPHSPKKHLEIIETLRPTGIVAVPSFMSAIYKQADKDNISLERSSLEKAVLIGETIRNPDFSSNALGLMVERCKRLETYSTYGITEIAAAFSECAEHKGLHSHPDLVYPEVVDESGSPVKDHETGELVVTTFQVEGMPLLRYRTGDITFRISEPCACGRNSIRIGPITGRKAHRLKVKGTTVYPRSIENALVGVEGVENYVIEAYTGDDYADRIVVRVGSNNTGSSFKLDISEAIRAKARVAPQVEIMPPQEVEKILYEGSRRKPMVFIDRRQKVHDVKL
ncbi:MAG: AMP-binding protein [Deltaproteobacteria bacterium]|nr:AMP-binding protein [Deltaproteobacteria bacterium]